MGDDIVELPEPGIDIHDVAVAQIDIPRAELGDGRSVPFNTARTQIDADKLACRDFGMRPE